MVKATIETPGGTTTRESSLIGEAIVKVLRDHTPLERSVLEELAEAVEFAAYGVIFEGDAARPFVSAAQDYLKYTRKQ